MPSAAPEFSRAAIKEIVRVGDPYLWIDEVVALSDEQIVARKFLDPGLPIFQAHYRDFPLFPGALQCEAAFQASAILIARTMPASPGHVPVIARVRNTKFRSMARPGEMLEIIVSQRGRIAKAVDLHGKLTADGRTTTELRFTATEAPVTT